jgi:two-component system sensor histidine kinase RegB
MGLGFFIAKTLLERSGARLELANCPEPQTGAVVTVVWPRAKFERAASIEPDTPAPIL